MITFTDLNQAEWIEVYEIFPDLAILMPERKICYYIQKNIIRLILLNYKKDKLYLLLFLHIAKRLLGKMNYDEFTDLYCDRVKEIRDAEKLILFFYYIS